MTAVLRYRQQLSYIHTFSFCTYVHTRAPKAQVRYCNDYATMVQCYNAISSHCLYVTSSSSWTDLTLRRERQVYVSSLPKGTYVCDPPALKLCPKVPDVANLQLHTLTNGATYIHTFFVVVVTRTLRAQVTADTTKYLLRYFLPYFQRY